MLSSNVTTLNRTFGVDKPFTFIVAPVLLLKEAGNIALVNRFEDTQTHVMVNPFLPNVEDFVCDGKPPALSLTPDCLSLQFNRTRRQGARRYQTLFGVLFDSTSNQYSALDVYHTKGIKSTVIVTVGTAAITFAFVRRTTNDRGRARAGERRGR
jgi:hypothetical protein